MTIRQMVALGLGAEERLEIDSLYLRLHFDGSGCVCRFDDTTIFRFDRLAELDAWLRKPRVVEYDEEGEPLLLSGARV